MVRQWEAIEINIDGRTFWVSPVGSWVLESGNVVAQALAVPLDKPLRWAVGLFFGNTEISLEYRDSMTKWEWMLWRSSNGFAVRFRGSSPCVAPNVVPMKAGRPLVEGIRVLNGSAVSAGMSGTLLLRSSSGFAVRCGGY